MGNKCGPFYLVTPLEDTRKQVVCKNLESYINFIGKYTRFNTEILNVWIKDGYDIPEDLPEEVYVISLDGIHVYIALQIKDVNDAIDYLQSRFPDTQLRMEETKIKLI